MTTQLIALDETVSEFLCPRCRASDCDRVEPGMPWSSHNQVLCPRCRAGDCDDLIVIYQDEGHPFLCPLGRAGLLWLIRIPSSRHFMQYLRPCQLWTVVRLVYKGDAAVFTDGVVKVRYGR